MKLAPMEVGAYPVGRPVLGKPLAVLTGTEPLAATADPEYRSRIEADQCTWQFSDKIRPEVAQESIADLPIFGGDRQQNLFGEEI